jgi:nucleoid-associated protein YgaU
MNSKSIALILGPSLAIVALFAGYWTKMHSPEPGAPLELHAGLDSPGAVISPPASITDENVAVFPADSPKPDASKPAEMPPAHVAAAPLSEPAPVPPAAPQPAAIPAPKFDVVRVEPSGDTVVAGHTEPNTDVAVVANGKVIAEGKSDAAGQFVLLPPALQPGDHALTLRVTPPSGAPIVSDQNVAVSVPVKGHGDVMVALAEPGKATVLLADPTAKVTAKAEEPKPPGASTAALKDNSKQANPPVKPEVSIKMAEIVEPGGFFVSGSAAPGAHMRLYLNGSAFAEVTAGVDGLWSVKVGKGLVSGHYAVRADQIDGSGTVLARAEVPFDYAAHKPTAVVAAMRPAAKAPDKSNPSIVTPGPDNATAAQAALSTANESQMAAASGANQFVHSDAAQASAGAAGAVVAEIQTATVEKGNNLWRISREMLGHGKRYTEIYAANSSQIRDPKLIYPGQVFVIPNQTN